MPLFPGTIGAAHPVPCQDQVLVGASHANAAREYGVAVDRLRDSERSRFVQEEWPAVRERMKRLGIDPIRLLDQETA